MLTAGYVGMENRAKATPLCNRLFEGLTRAGSPVAYQLCHFTPGRKSFVSCLGKDTAIRRCVLAYLPPVKQQVMLVEAALGAAFAGAGYAMINCSPPGESQRYLHSGTNDTPSRAVADGSAYLTRHHEDASKLRPNTVRQYYLRRLLRVANFGLLAGINTDGNGKRPEPDAGADFSIRRCYLAYVSPTVPKTLRKLPSGMAPPAVCAPPRRPRIPSRERRTAVLGGSRGGALLRVGHANWWQLVISQ